MSTLLKLTLFHSLTLSTHHGCWYCLLHGSNLHKIQFTQNCLIYWIRNQEEGKRCKPITLTQQTPELEMRNKCTDSCIIPQLACAFCVTFGFILCLQSNRLSQISRTVDALKWKEMYQSILHSNRNNHGNMNYIVLPVYSSIEFVLYLPENSIKMLFSRCYVFRFHFRSAKNKAKWK